MGDTRERPLVNERDRTDGDKVFTQAVPLSSKVENSFFAFERSQCSKSWFNL